MMIINEGDFKTIKQVLQLFGTHVKASEQRKNLFEYDYYEIDPLTKKDVRSIMNTLDKIFFADELGLTDDLSTEDLEKGW